MPTKPEEVQQVSQATAGGVELGLEYGQSLLPDHTPSCVRLVTQPRIGKLSVMLIPQNKHHDKGALFYFYFLFCQ